MSNSDVEYELTIKEFEAIIGVRKILVRNDKKLDVKIPTGVKNGNQIRLRGALKLTDGNEGDILIKVVIADVVKPDSRNGTDLALIFDTCFNEIGGRANKDVKVYLDKRSMIISRNHFFEQALWSIWVSGMSRKAAEGFMRKVEPIIANYNYQSFGALDSHNLDSFMAKLHEEPIRPRARKKWEALHYIAKWLSSFSSENDFRDKIFKGKSKGPELDKTDVRKLKNLRLPFIGEANSNYLIKNLGGQAIKPERWVEAFLNWGKISISHLESQLKALQIPLSLFDTAFWSYCEMYIGRVESFDSHFTTKFGYLK